jgi:hypothetical protein
MYASHFRRLHAAALTPLFVFSCGAADAGSVTQPGETVGMSIGAPLPEGVYAVSTGSVGYRNGDNLFINVPLAAWSTPWTLGGGRVEVVVASPQILNNNVNTDRTRYGWYSPLIAGMIAFDLGNGFGLSYLAGAYIPVAGGGFDGAYDQWTFRQDVHLTYAKNDWTAAANLIFGVVGKNMTRNASNPDFFNYDLSITRNFYGLNIGPVAFGSTDVNVPAGYPGRRNSQFAMGSLIGRDFGPFSAQFYVTRDLVTQGYSGKETRFFLRLAVPAWQPAKPAAVQEAWLQSK